MNGCDQSERLCAIIDELTESRERWYGMAKQFAVELTKAKRERDDAREHADCEKQFADGLKKRIAELEMVLDDERAHCEEFKAEADRAQKERDDAIEYGDTEHEFAESLVKDLHEARNVARDYRDLYAAEIDESIAAFPFPWEEDHDADRDGE